MSGAGLSSPNSVPGSAQGAGSPQILDLAIIGGGPTALTAALYAARAGLKVTVFERGKIGGALTEISKIANYPGFVDVAGQELADKFRTQAEQAGATVEYGECTQVERVVVDGSVGQTSPADSSALGGSSANASYFHLTIDEEPVEARTVLIATGSEPRQLGFELDVPVSYCALCDANFAKDRDIAVVGGANSAVQEALYLAPLVKSVTIISHSALKADRALLERLEAAPNITVRENVEPTAELLNQFGYVFVFIGKRPATRFLEGMKFGPRSGSGVNSHSISGYASDSDLPLLDETGYVLTGDSISAGNNSTPMIDRPAGQPGSSWRHATCIPGLFAAGDVRSGAVRQIITAAGDGAAAATEVISYLKA